MNVNDFLAYNLPNNGQVILRQKKGAAVSFWHSNIYVSLTLKMSFSPSVCKQNVNKNILKRLF